MGLRERRCAEYSLFAHKFERLRRVGGAPYVAEVHSVDDAARCRVRVEPESETRRASFKTKVLQNSLWSKFRHATFVCHLDRPKCSISFFACALSIIACAVPCLY